MVSIASGKRCIFFGHDILCDWWADGIISFWMRGEVHNTGSQMLPRRHRFPAFNGRSGSRTGSHMAYDAGVWHQNQRFIIGHWFNQGCQLFICIGPHEKSLYFNWCLWQWPSQRRRPHHYSQMMHKTRGKETCLYIAIDLFLFAEFSS